MGEWSNLEHQCYTLLSMILGVVLGELLRRFVLSLESLWKTLCEPKKSKMKGIKRNLWLCMADKHGQIWKVANILIEYYNRNYDKNHYRPF